MSTQNTPILEVRELGIDFGGLTAVNNLNLTVYPNEIVGLIGPNGAGKTTVFNMLTKVYQPSRGEIKLAGVSTEKMDTVEVNKAGIARTFQNIRLFTNMSVIDNVKLGMHNAITYSTLSAIFRTSSFKKQEKEAEKMLEYENVLIPEDFDYQSVQNLALEAREKLNKIHPTSIGQAMRISGVNPADISILMIELKRRKYE